MKFARVLAALKSDYWYNPVSKLGAPGTAGRSAAYHRSAPMTTELLDQLWQSSWLAARIVKEIPDQALKFKMEADVEKIYRRLNFANPRLPEGYVHNWQYQGRLYGGAALILGLKGTGLDTRAPTEPENGGVLSFLDVAPKHQLQVVSKFTDRAEANFGQPEILRVIGDHPRKDLEIHTSRILWSVGKPLFSSATTSSALGSSEEFLGLSVLEDVLEILKQHGKAWGATGQLVEEASIGVLKQKGLFDAISSDDTAEFEDRVMLLQQMKSVANLLLLDADSGEEFRREDVSFTGLADILKEQREVICGATGIPATILWGSSAPGMNSTGEFDLRQFHDRIDVFRESQLEPKLERLLHFATGKPVEIEWAPLFEPTATELETERKTRFETDKLILDLGTLEPEEIIIARAEAGELGFDLMPGRLAELKKILKDLKNEPKTDPVPPIGNFLPAGQPAVGPNGAGTSTPGANPTEQVQTGQDEP